MIELQVSDQGFEARRRAIVQAHLKALKLATHRAADVSRTRLNDDVAKSLSTKRTFLPWTYDVFPLGNKLAYEPSAVIRSRAPHITNPQTTGARINGQDGNLIPVPGSPAAEVRRFKGGRPKIDIIKQRYGDFYEIKPLGPGRGFLMLWPAIKGYRKRKGQPLREGYFSAWEKERVKGKQKKFTGFMQMRQGHDIRMIPMFIWKPQVTLSPRLKTLAIFRQLERDFPQLVAEQLARATAQAGGQSERAA